MEPALILVGGLAERRVVALVDVNSGLPVFAEDFPRNVKPEESTSDDGYFHGCFSLL
jgi:hypothetical protein